MEFLIRIFLQMYWTFLTEGNGTGMSYTIWYFTESREGLGKKHEQQTTCFIKRQMVLNSDISIIPVKTRKEDEYLQPSSKWPYARHASPCSSVVRASDRCAESWVRLPSKLVTNWIYIFLTSEGIPFFRKFSCEKERSIWCLTGTTGFSIQMVNALGYQRLAAREKHQNWTWVLVFTPVSFEHYFHSA